MTRIVIGSRRSLLGVALALLGSGSFAACSASSAPATVSSAPATAGAGPSSSAAAGTPSVSAASLSATASTPPTATARPVLRLTSGAFAEGAAIPGRYTCDGSNVSPPLAWSGLPSDATALVLVVDDPDAHGFVHWVAFDIAATPSGQLAEGASAGPDRPRQGTNSFGRAGWSGPCPPSGTHHYRFRLLAVRRPLGLGGAPTAAEVLAAARGQVVGETTLTGIYHR